MFMQIDYDKTYIFSGSTRNFRLDQKQIQYTGNVALHLEINEISLKYDFIL